MFNQHIILGDLINFAKFKHVPKFAMIMNFLLFFNIWALAKVTFFKEGEEGVKTTTKFHKIHKMSYEIKIHFRSYIILKFKTSMWDMEITAA